jgi:hypothetical protein
MATTILDNLISLRQQYEAQLSDASTSAFAREQLSHIYPLLVDQLQAGSGKTSGRGRRAAAAVTEDTDEAPVVTRRGRGAAKTPKAPKAPKVPRTPRAAKAAPATNGRRGPKPGRPSTRVAKPKGTVGSRIKLTMANEYQGLSKIDAVGKIMEENRNQIVHMNDIIEKMFGTLDDKEMKAEQMRMKDTLIRGVRRGLWQKAKGVPLSYFLGSVPAGAVKAAAKSSTTAKSPVAVTKKAPGKRRTKTSTLSKPRATTPKTKKATTSKVKTKTLSSARKKAVPARKGGRLAKK